VLYDRDAEPSLRASAVVVQALYDRDAEPSLRASVVAVQVLYTRATGRTFGAWWWD
jgi:hypothetical protein